MPHPTIECGSNFIGTFKVGDNLVFNCHLLCQLESANNEGRFNKLIVLQVGSILEAALSEIIFRAQKFNREGVPNISESDRSEIAGKKIDKLNSIIDVMRKYKILNSLGEDIYSELHKLRKYRNKVHIQDNIEIEGVSRDEDVAFSSEICEWALKLNAKLLKYLSENLARPTHIEGYVGQLIIPAP